MKDRLSKVKKLMVDRRLDALLISSIPNIIYLTNYSGFSKDEREAYLFITENKQYILTDGRYSEAVEPVLKYYKLLERTPKFTYQKIFTALGKKHRIKKLGIEEDNLTVDEYKLVNKYFDDTYHYSISLLRLVKDAQEITAIGHAARLGDKVFDNILSKLVSGVTEKHIAFEIEFVMKKNGADPSFPPIVAFGANSSKPHHQTSDKRLTTGDFVLLDFGVKLDNYCSDMTRTVFFGKATSEQKKMYQTVLDAQQKSIDYLQKCHSELVSESLAKKRSRNKFGMTGKKVDKVARDYIVSQGYPTIPHSLGHGIGLEVHELPSLSPNSKGVLNTGMVFSVEPGIYIPKFGGVRVEDLVVLEKNGPRVITHSSKELIEL